MAEYIDRNDVVALATDYGEGQNVMMLIDPKLVKKIHTADVIERSEYEFLKQLNKELAIKYDNAMNIAINANEQLEKLQSKIKGAIEEMKEIQAKTKWTEDMQEWTCYKNVLDILKRHIGE